MFDNSAVGGDTVEKGIRGDVLPPTIWDSDGLVRSRRGQHAIATVCQTSCPPLYGHVAEQRAAPSVV